ncbi:MAG: caspase family protein [Leptothrix sp. (in: b-proteobacteria)]
MKYRRFRAGVARGVLLAGMLGMAGQVHAAVYALLIGINKYQGSNIKDLQGPVNDVQLMKKVLMGGHFRVPDANITMLLDEQATHTGIETAFRQLAERVGKTDQVYIHYSGHGSWYKAQEPKAGEKEERNKQDQTWVSYGARARPIEGTSDKDNLDVLDKELGLWLAPIYAKTEDVVVVADSCHSASSTRDNPKGVRSVDGLNEQPHPLRAGIEKPAPDPTVGLRIGSAGDRESAREVGVGANSTIASVCTGTSQCFGAFTWFWAQALQSSQPGDSWRDVFQRAKAGFHSVPDLNHRPQMEGVADREVFGGKEAKWVPKVTVLGVKKTDDRTVLLDAGRLSGMTVGSVFEGRASDGKVLRLKVKSVDVITAEAVLESDGSVKVGDLVKEVAHVRNAKAQLKIHFSAPPADVDAGLVNQVREEIRREPRFKDAVLDAPEAEASLRLVLVRPKEGTLSEPVRLPEHQVCSGSTNCPPPQLWVLTPQGQLLHPKLRFKLTGDDEEIKRLIDDLGAYMRSNELAELGRQGNKTPVKALVSVLRPPSASSTCAWAMPVAPGMADLAQGKPFAQLGGGDVRKGDCLAFTLENKSDKEWHGYVLSIDSDFAIKLIWPPRQNEEEALMPADEKTLKVPALYNLTELGIEKLVFISSRPPVSMEPWLQSGMRSVEDGIPYTSQDWGAELIDFSVEEKPVAQRH